MLSILLSFWHNENFWSTFGKISAMLGLVGTCIAILNTCAPGKEANLAASVYARPFYYPPDLKSLLREVRGLHSEQYLSKILNKKRSGSEKLTQEQITSTAFNLRIAFRRQWPEQLDLDFDWPKYSGYLQFVIRNNGDREAENVVIGLPYSGIASVTHSDSKSVEQHFNNSINVGSIRPGTLTKIQVWSTDTPYEFYEDEIKITHKAGVADIAFGREADSLSNAFVVHLGLEVLFYIALIIAFVAYFIISVAFQEISSRRQQQYILSGRKF